MTAQRRFKPSFRATVRLGRVNDAHSPASGPYLVAPGSTVTMPDGKKVTRTVMAFGPAVARTREMLQDSDELRLTVRFDGGAVLVIGPAEPAKPRPARTAPKSMMADCVAAAGFDEHASYGF